LNPNPNHHHSLADIADLLNADSRLVGEQSAESVITGLAGIEEAAEGQISFCASEKFVDAVKKSKASAVLLTPEFYEKADLKNVNCLLVPKPELSFSVLTKVFQNYPAYEEGIHPSAVVDESASLGSGVSICANAVVEKGAFIADNCVVGPGSVVGQFAKIGSGTRLFANVSVYQYVEIGESCIVHSGTALGCDGFGFVPGEVGLEKLYQLGTLIIGNKVEIGSNCTIDRGALSNTIIGDGVKMDNQVHIAHNVLVGNHTAFAGCVGVAGSTKIGSFCQFGGQVGINGHIEVCDGVTVTGKGLVAKSIKEPGVYSSGIPAGPNRDWRKSALRFYQLDDMAKAIKALQKKIDT
jgi:UDP-3-O-[3-hydroxymyristoyl] glucosamine N-acyltransferase